MYTLLQDSGHPYNWDVLEWFLFPKLNNRVKLMSRNVFVLSSEYMCTTAVVY
jgi:hypothetical protein